MRIPFVVSKVQFCSRIILGITCKSNVVLIVLDQVWFCHQVFYHFTCTYYYSSRFVSTIYFNKAIIHHVFSFFPTNVRVPNYARCLITPLLGFLWSSWRRGVKLNENYSSHVRQSIISFLSRSVNCRKFNETSYFFSPELVKLHSFMNKK